MNRLILLVGALACVLLVLLWLIWPSTKKDEHSTLSQQVVLEPRDVVLYFTDVEGLSLVSEERRIDGCNDERQCIAQTIEALAEGSQLLSPVIPQRTRVLNVDVDGDLARIRFSRELADMHPGGSLSELLTVYGLTNTLAVNFPYLRQLQIEIDGRAEKTLKGHVDISRPIKAEFRYNHDSSRRAQEGSQGELPLAEDKSVISGG